LSKVNEADYLCYLDLRLLGISLVVSRLRLKLKLSDAWFLIIIIVIDDEVTSYFRFGSKRPH